MLPQPYGRRADVQPRSSSTEGKASSATLTDNAAIMLRTILTLCALLPALCQAAPRLVAYFPFWASYSHGSTLADVPAQELTHVIYAHARLKPDGTVIPGDFFADLGRISTSTQGLQRGNWSHIPALKERNPKLKVLLSLGGWNWSPAFSAVMNDPAKRQRAVVSLTQLLARHGFDGVELDWRDPVIGGKDPTARDAQDLEHYQRFLKALRPACVRCEIVLALTPAALSSGDWAPLIRQVDWVSLVTHEYAGAWSSRTGHRAPLFGDMSIDHMVRTLVSAGVPAEKLVPTVPTLAISWQGAASPHTGALHHGVPWGTWDNEQTGPSGVFTRSELAQLRADGMTPYWDSTAQAAYLFRPRDGVWISYESTQALDAKLDYVRTRGLGGLALWDASSDGIGADSLITRAYTYLHPWHAWLPFWPILPTTLIIAIAYALWRHHRRHRAVPALAGILETLPEQLARTATLSQALAAQPALPAPVSERLRQISFDSALMAHTLGHVPDDLCKLKQFSEAIAGEHSTDTVLEVFQRFVSGDARVLSCMMIDDDGDTSPPHDTPSIDIEDPHGERKLVLALREGLDASDLAYFEALAAQIRNVREQLHALLKQPQLLSELLEVATRRERLLYIRAERGYCGIYATDLKHPRHITLRLRALRAYFGDQLVQVHRSFLVPPHAVRGARKQRNGTVLLVGADEIPVSRAYVAPLRARFPQWFDDALV
ncbi:glycosyl hydrolase family 18 protein [Chitinibacteraceae bacterium HSL-7]